jgi:ABC-type oligopeptide transport system substrate-binding subunit
MKAILDSTVISLVALRVINGNVLLRVTESILIGLFALTLLAGCSSQSAKTVEKEKTVRYATSTDPAQTDPMVTEKRTTRTEESTRNDGQSTGLLSGAVNVVGEALALPFRFVGGLISAIF